MVLHRFFWQAVLAADEVCDHWPQEQFQIRRVRLGDLLTASDDDTIYYAVCWRNRR